MESQNNNQYLKPSKHFLIRGGIASLIITLILIAQTDWFLNIFSKNKNSSIKITDATVGDIVDKDSNSNGIPDWEERLWGLDPKVSTTNGISNKVIIETKRKSLQGDANTNQSLNETDILARELFSFTNALGDESSINSDSLSAIASKLGAENAKTDTVPVYSLKDIITNNTNVKNLSNYKKNISASLEKYKTEVPEIEIFIKSLETGDYSNMESLDLTIEFYKNLSKKIVKIPVPVGVAQYHLDIVNSVIGVSNSFKKMQSIEDNGINALIGLSEYKFHDQKLNSAVENLNIYLNEYGII